MKLKFFYIPLLTGLILFGGISCETTLDMDIPLPDDKIVIDGWIESGDYARVLLTKNTPYFSTLDSASLVDLVLSRAKVSLVYDKDTTILTLRKNENYFPPVIYEANEYRGIPGKEYEIIAEYGGKSAKGKTTVPETVNIDTIYQEALTDSTVRIIMSFKDPPEKNFYRLLIKRKGKDSTYRSTLFTALDDQYFNGGGPVFSIDGMDEVMKTSTENKFVKGDTVQIKLCTMDRESFLFWSSYQDEMANSNNPFAASLSEVISNIEGDGLGVFSGYGVSFRQIILQ